MLLKSLGLLKKKKNSLVKMKTNQLKNTIFILHVGKIV